MNRVVKKILLVITALAMVALSLMLVSWVSERVFFDRLFYNKSIKHGYWMPDKHLSFKDYGMRGQDMARLYYVIKNPQSSSLGAIIDKGVFTIAVFGDSYAWGQGLQEKDRFIFLLERLLNKMRPTKIYSFAASGDGIVDTYIKYMHVQKNLTVDLFLFTIVDNDLLLRKENLYDDRVQQALISSCNKPVVYDPFNLSGTESYEPTIDSYNDTYGNKCIFQQILDNLPRERALYFNYGKPFWFWNENFSNAILHEYSKRGMFVFSPKVNPVAKKTKIYFVSKKDPHPSAYANRIFASTIFDKIASLDYFK